jgi:hypothetical protein
VSLRLTTWGWAQATDLADVVCWSAVRGLLTRDPAVRAQLSRTAPLVLAWYDRVDALPALQAAAAAYTATVGTSLKVLLCAPVLPVCPCG